MGLDYPKETALSKARSLFFTLDGILTGFIASYVSIRSRKAKCLRCPGAKTFRIRRLRRLRRKRMPEGPSRMQAAEQHVGATTGAHTSLFLLLLCFESV